jgi:S-adenosylmethionine decarboxylase
MKILGQHLLVEFYDCNRAVLNSQSLIRTHMEEAAITSNATIVQSVFHTFNPHGVSGVVVIAESHLAIHTWPEYNYAAVDLFTCGTGVNPYAAFEYLKDSLEAAHFTTREFHRGLPASTGAVFPGPDSRLAHKPAPPMLPPVHAPGQ